MMSESRTDLDMKAEKLPRLSYLRLRGLNSQPQFVIKRCRRLIELRSSLCTLCALSTCRTVNPRPDPDSYAQQKRCT